MNKIQNQSYTSTTLWNKVSWDCFFLFPFLETIFYWNHSSKTYVGSALLHRRRESHDAFWCHKL